MKKYFFLLIVMITSISLAAEIVQHSYYFQNPKISETGEYQILEFKNTKQAGISGEPALPYFPVKLLLPPGKIASSIVVTGIDEINLNGTFQLYPMQASRPVSLGNYGKFIKNESLYNSNLNYPAEKHGHLTTEFMNGFGFALCTISPINYIPASGELSYFRELTVKIHLADDPNYLNSQQYLKSNTKIDKKIREFAQNTEMINSYNVTPSSREGEYDVLIIATADFENSFQDLIDLHLTRGLITEIVTINEINSSMTGQDIQEKTRNYIIQEYQNNDVSNVILAGDCELIPYRGFYCYVQSGNGHEDYGIPADLYYAALDGTWDDDGDGIWGEIGEDDLLPEIAVSRLTFNIQDELDNILNKSMMYQTQPVLGELDSPLLAGENMYNDPMTWGGDYLDLLIGYHDDNGYETFGIPTDDNYVTMYDRDMGSWSASQLMTEINQGHSFIYHAGHSNYGYNMRMDDWQITNQNFSQINGIDHNFTMVYSHGCNAGGFDVSDCIAEYMVMIDNFAAIYIGCSRYGWFNEGQTEGPSAHMNREFCDALYDADYYLVGEANMDSKIDTSPWVTAPGQWEEGALRWTFYGTNVLGDGSIPIWTDEPFNLDLTYEPNIFLGTTNYEVQIDHNGSGIENVNCVLIQNGEMISIASTDGSGTANLQFDAAAITPGEISLFVSGNNCLLTEYQLQVVPAGYFVQVSDHSIFSGNDNILEFGENAFLSLTLQEIGNVGDVHNAEVTISETDDYITINDDYENVGTINGGSSLDLIDAFDFDVSNDVPDQHIFTIEIEITSNEGTWQSQIDLTAFTADIHVETVTIDDGGNGILDPGETSTMNLELMNDGGADAYNVLLNLQTSNPYVSILVLPFSIDSLNSEGTGTYPVCDITLDSSAPLGEVVSFELEITADNGYYTENDFDLITGLLIEDFETGDFAAMNWSFSGDADWVIDDEVYEGVYSAKSGNISHYDDSSMEIEYEVITEGTISFWKKVSSEEDYDFLRFYLDDVLQDEWSGNDDWTMESFTIQPGMHTFRWTYYKDQAVSGGDDCGWIDYITFPPVNMNVSSPQNNITEITRLIGNHPNPFNPTTTIDFVIAETAQYTTLEIFNIKGQKVNTLINKVIEVGGHSVLWNGNDNKGRQVSSGIYFYKLKIGNLEQTRKMIMLK